MEEDESSKLSPALDLNQSVSNGNDEEVKGELGQDQTQTIWQQEDAEARVSSADAEEAEAPPSGDGVAKAPHSSDDGVARVSQLDVAGNGEDKELPFRTGHGHASGSPSPGKASPARNNNIVASPSKRESSPPAKQAPSPVSRSKRMERSKSPSPKKTRSSAGGHRSSSRSPEGRRRSASRSPEARHGRRKEDSKRRHDRSRSPAGRSHRRERSRSWSPYERERERERRSRYSPRRRSSPPRYSSRGDRSPRKRPWSPPRNRNTGVGKPGNHLFVAGFSFATTERDLEKKFGRYGRVSDVRIIRDRRSGDSRGFGFLSLERDEEADDAIRGLDQTEWNGRIVLVEKAKTN